MSERGCGFEAPLEAWYRFLVDPQPPEEIVLSGIVGTVAESTGVDDVLLAQREAFLRPESWVAIVVLTDENDGSVTDGGTHYTYASYGWLVAEATRPMRAATEVCDTNPNDPCCVSCLQAGNPPAGCEEAVSVCETASELTADMDRASALVERGSPSTEPAMLPPTKYFPPANSIAAATRRATPRGSSE